MGKIFTALNSINSFSKKMIIYSSCVAIISCIIGICLITVNSAFFHNVELYKVASTLIQRISFAFAQFIIGALIFDWFNANFQNDD